jgi:biopolymer transport protein ExbB
MDLEQRLLDFSLLGAGWVLWTLVALSAACVVVAVERAAYFRLNKTEDAAMEAAMASFLKNGDTAEFQTALDALGGIQARVLAAGLDASRDGPESVEEVIAGTLVFEKSRAERGLLILGTVGSNAPFIGLFGTVLGIIKAFHDLAAAQSEATEAVMAGISEALVATAIGLMVAIPAVILYNTFQGKVKSAMSKSQSLSHLVLAKIKSAQSEAS